MVCLDNTYSNNNGIELYLTLASDTDPGGPGSNLSKPYLNKPHINNPPGALDSDLQILGVVEGTVFENTYFSIPKLNDLETAHLLQ